MLTVPLGQLLIYHIRKVLTSLSWEIKKVVKKIKVMFGNNFYFLFSKTCFEEYKEKKIFLYFWNQKHVWFTEIKKIEFWKKKLLKYVVPRIWTLIANLLNEIDSLN